MAKKAKPKSATAEHCYSADRPIRAAREDLLGRLPFAASLAKDIRAWAGRDSLVIALYGGWGCGKTSLKNLILLHLKKGKAKTPVMEFNPWQFSGTGNIASAFFTELGIALGNADGAADGAARAKKLERYAKRLAVGGTTVEAIGNVLSMIGLPGSPLVTAVGGGLKKMGDATQEGSDALKSEVKNRSLSDLKRDLATSLAALKDPILVVIDDIDRLTTDEVREILQLVKANADFPNLIYLLLCERSVVTEALDGISGGRGSEFLEKIVQVGYEVPQVSRGSVQKVLFAGLDRSVGQPGVNARWQKERWRDAFLDGISLYFQNLRHVYRFLASFDFHIRQFQTGDGFEVNPVDLIVLEVLRVFEPGVYERLPAAKRILVGDGSMRTLIAASLRLDGDEQEIINSAVTQLLSHAPERRRDQVKILLHVLFPHIRPTHSGEREEAREMSAWLRHARVCHRDLFDKYFTLAVTENDLTQVELERLVETAADREKFVTECEALHNRGLLSIAFERLDAFKDEIPTETLPSLLRALCDLGDSVLTSGQDYSPFSSSDLPTFAWRIVRAGLRRIKSSSDRFGLLRDAFLDSPGIFLPVDITSLVLRKNNSELEAFVSETEENALRDICLVKIRNTAETGTLRAHVRSDFLLWRWREWAPDGEVQEWVAQECTLPEAAAWLLSRLMGCVTSSASAEARHYMRLSDVGKYADIAMLETSIAAVDENALSEKERTAVKEFRRAVERRNDGKPEIQGYQRFEDEE